MNDTTYTRISTSCSATRFAEAKAKLGLDEHATLDSLLLRVIQGDTDKQLSLEGWLILGKKFINNDRAQAPTKDTK
jgi:hypothetical protein